MVLKLHLWRLSEYLSVYLSGNRVMMRAGGWPVCVGHVIWPPDPVLLRASSRSTPWLGLTINIDLVTAHASLRLGLVTAKSVQRPGPCPAHPLPSPSHFCPVLWPGLASGHKPWVPGTSLDHLELAPSQYNLPSPPLPSTELISMHLRLRLVPYR